MTEAPPDSPSQHPAFPEAFRDTIHPSPPKASRLWDKWLVPCLLALVVIVIHSPSLTHQFAVTDAYNTLDMAQRGALPLLHNGMTITGRPITSLLVVPSFRLLDSVGDLSYLRAGALAFAVGFFLMLYGILRRLNIPPLQAGCFSLLMGLTPAFSNYVTWTVQWPYPLGAALAMLAGWMTFHAFLSPPVKTKSLILAGVLLVCIPMIYQILPGYFMLPVVALCLFGGCDTRRLRAWVLSLVFYFSCMVIYVLAFKIYDWTIAQKAWPEHAARNQITGDLLAKAVFLAKEIPPKIFASWAFYFGPTMSIVGGLIVLILCLIGVVPLFKKASLPTKLFRLLLLGSAAGLTIAPLVATAASQAPTRTLGPTVSIVFLVAISGLWQLLRIVPERWKKTANLAVIILAGVVGGGAYYTILWGLAIPQEWELQTFREELHKLEESPGWVIFVHPEEYASPRSPLQGHDTEYNFNSSWFKWVPAPMINVLVKEKVDAGEWAPSPMNYVFVPITATTYPQPVGKAPVIDSNRLLFGKTEAPAQDPILNVDSVFGPLSSLMYPDNYYYSPLLGFFYSGNLLSNSGSMTLFLPQLGTLVMTPDPDNGIRVWVTDRGWAPFDLEAYPSVRIPNSGEILNLLDTETQP